ncbi:PilW family protein [Pseudomonas quasicaspiana]|uniref:PilW family protein n=1 Tax=Pseudomonas quasicaspiana TaxID=2829821 RepID=UPI001E463FD4|nr:prepilin-type N-terminal cleavage/methylation domain-containing protein [Pseudomonas quasicaspiana]MCD5972296.1 prepilin-type N-terminal cleavage/methylation domain-containing protein [Pseudomonas quasicaspiana]MCD5980055.1 prepilin-type N-terminal cleavage/methylation domain-containing protein [Pseudomonas quasicaspiana]
MKNIARGFGLVEIMVALVLGLIVSMGIVQIFIASKGTYQSQNAAARMQEDARFALSKMMQEIRMTGMFGCLDLDTTTPVAPSIVKPPDFLTPILWDNASNTLTLITADVGTSGSTPTWTVVSDCRTYARIYNGARTPASGEISFPLRKITYSLTGTNLNVKVGTGSDSAQPLVSNVGRFAVSFGLTGSPMSYTTVIGSSALANNIRSVRLTLTVTDPNGRVRDQTYNVVAALRNRF